MKYIKSSVRDAIEAENVLMLFPTLESFEQLVLMCDLDLRTFAQVGFYDPSGENVMTFKEAVQQRDFVKNLSSNSSTE